MLTIIVFVLILSLLIFVHELGHFIMAKKAGVMVEEFAIGFPPRAMKVWQDEGKMTLNGQEYLINRRTGVPRKLQVGSEVYTETKTRSDGRVEITKIEILTPRKEENIEEDTRHRAVVEALERPTEYSINWIPFGGYVKMLGEEDPTSPGSFASKSKMARFVVLVAGAGMNLITAVLTFTVMFMTGIPEDIGPTYIVDVAPNSPAEEIGLHPNDIILQVDDIAIQNSLELAEYIRSRRGQEINLHVKRGDIERTLNLVPRVNPPPGEGSIGVIIGTRQTSQRITRFPFGESLLMGATATTGMVIQTFAVPIEVLKNMIPAEQARPVGPVGIYNLTDSAVGTSVEIGVIYPLLLLTAILSTALAVTNLLPLPALDGGRILFIIIEAIRGKRVSPEKEGAIHFIGLALLLTLLVVISYNDVSNPIEVPDWTSLF
ncbi:MAG: RIP metalloprotease [Anaerolineae bacterium]